MPRKKKSNLPYTRIKGGKLYVCIPYKVGTVWKQKARLVANQEEAVRAMAEIREELAIRGPGAFDGERMTFKELAAEYRRAHEVSRWYWEPIEAFFGDRRIRTITYADLKQFRASREKIPKKFTGEPRTQATINRELEHLRSVLLYALRHGWIRYNPFAAGPPLILKGEEERRTRIPTPAEEAAILAECVPPYRAHLRPLIIATRDTGLRRSALLALTWSMVDLENRLLRIPKGNLYKRRPAVIGLTGRLYEELRRLRDLGSGEGKIFRDIREFKTSYTTACRKAGVTGLRFNDFRHGFATDLMEAGIPQHMAMKLSGHTQADTHEIYANIDDRLALQAAAALDLLHLARAGDISTGSQLIN